MVQVLLKTIYHMLKKLNIYLAYSTVILLVGIYQEK
jgi:hypothetical protein